MDSFTGIAAVLQLGLPGTYGLNALADILAGNVNPSGHLVDTVAYDAFSSPAAQNYGDFQYVDEAGNLTRYSYLTYAEGIYVGCRYYETRYEDAVLGQGNAGDYDYEATVQYPFGYGLSYTAFEWSDFAVTETSEGFEVSVIVKNTGSVAGKDVVQVYLQSPYTDYDKQNGVEKSAVDLVAYAKTKLLNAGESETVTASFSKEQLKAYDAKGAGTVTYLTRSDWAGTFPKHDGEVSEFESTWGNEINGADGKLNYSGQYDIDLTDPAVYRYAREASHRILYTVANSKAMSGAVHGAKLTGIPTAAVLRIVLSVVSILGIALLTFFNVRRWTKKPSIIVVDKEN